MMYFSSFLSQITPADGLPNVVCRKCREQLDICHRFREVAHKSQKSLEQFLQLTTKFEGSAQVSYQKKTKRKKSHKHIIKV